MRRTRFATQSRNFTGRNNAQRMKSEVPCFPKVDKRLLGTWKSDRKRTFQEWKWTKRLTPQKKKRFESLFGKLEVTYTRVEVIMTLRYRKWEHARQYAIVAVDETSVAVVHFGETKIKNRKRYDPDNLNAAVAIFGSKPKIQHIHFDKKHCWISLGSGRNREFFRKIRDSN